MNIELVKDTEEKTINILERHYLRQWYIKGYKCKNIIETLLMFSNIEIKTLFEFEYRRLLYNFNFLVHCILGHHHTTYSGLNSGHRENPYLRDAIQIINKCENVEVFLILIIMNTPIPPFIIERIHYNDINCLKKHETQILNCKEKMSPCWDDWCDILIYDYKKFVLKVE